MSEADISISNQSLKIHDIFLNYLENQIYTDVAFKVRCDGDTEKFVTYKAHRLPLSVFSPVFADMFYGSTQGYSTPVIITDVTPDVFIVMLKFMYGSVCELTRQQRDVKFLLKLYQAALQYQIEALQCFCRNKLASMTPDEHSVFHLLDAASTINDEDIREKCIKVLETRTIDVLLCQEDLSDVSHAMMMTILNLKNVSFASEYDLICYVLDWVSRHCLRPKDKQENISFRNVLDSVLGNINLTAMSPNDFGNLLFNYPNVFSDVEISKIFRNIVDPGSCPLPQWANARIFRTYKYTLNKSDKLASTCATLEAEQKESRVNETALREQLEIANKEIKDLNYSLNSEIKSNQELKNTCKSLAEEKAVLQSRLDKLASTFATLDAEQKESRVNEAAAREQLEIANKEMKDLNDSLNSEIKSYQKQIQELNDALTYSKKKVQSLECQSKLSSNLKEKLKVMEQEKLELGKQLSLKADQVQKLEKDIETERNSSVKLRDLTSKEFEEELERREVENKENFRKMREQILSSLRRRDNVCISFRREEKEQKARDPNLDLNDVLKNFKKYISHDSCSFGKPPADNCCLM